MESKALAKTQPAADDQNYNLMQMVISSGNVEQLERFMAAKEREEARQALIQFDIHFAAMQSEMPRVPRSKQSHTNKYAPLESLQQLCGPTIAKHGFSYFWREESLEKGKRVTLVISGWGYSKEVSFDVPLMPGTNAMNPVQVAATLSSYGKRYTFTSGFGIIICDEDTDGNVGASEEDDEVFADLMMKAREAKYAPKELGELKQRYSAMLTSKSLPKLVKALNEEIDARLQRKAEIKKAEAK